MFIHTTDSDANINTSKYSTLKHSFQTSNQSTAEFQVSRSEIVTNANSWHSNSFTESTLNSGNTNNNESLSSKHTEFLSFQETHLNSPKNQTISLNQSRIDRLEASFTLKLSEFYQSLQPLDYQVLTNPSPPLRSIRDKLR